MRLGANRLILPLFPAFLPQNSTTPPPPMEFVKQQEAASTPLRCVGSLPGDKALLARLPPRMGLEAPGEAHPHHPHIPVCHQTPPRPSIPTRSPASLSPPQMSPRLISLIKPALD